jgi:serpin B
MALPRSLLSLLGTASVASVAACSAGHTDPAPAPSGYVEPPQAVSSVAREPASQIAPAALADAVAANNAFAVDLYARLRKDQANANFVTAPLTASLALGMTYAGADGATATQMASALHIKDPSTFADGQNALSQALGARAADALAQAESQASDVHQGAPNATDFQVQVVNSLWGQKGYVWGQPFLDTLARSYGAGVTLEDFIKDTNQAILDINGWVSNQTNDKIQNLLSPSNVDASTRLVLVDAVHVKLPWADPFDPTSTAPATFTHADGTTTTASFMNAAKFLPYTDDGSAQIVAIPLTGNALSLVIALPHGDLATYEAGLTAGSAALAEPRGGGLISLSLPKFDFTSGTFSLSAALQAMGMADAFDAQKASFQAMCPTCTGLYVGDVSQKAMIAVQENGLEAAGATAVGILAGAAPTDPTVMKVNRPFVISLVDAPTGAVLFLGHVTDPGLTAK